MSGEKINSGTCNFFFWKLCLGMNKLKIMGLGIHNSYILLDFPVL